MSIGASKEVEKELTMKVNKGKKKSIFDRKVIKKDKRK